MLEPEAIERLQMKVAEEANGAVSMAGEAAVWAKGIFELMALEIKARSGAPARFPDPRHTLSFRWVADKGKGPGQVDLLRTLAHELGWDYNGYEVKGENHNVLFLTKRP